MENCELVCFRFRFRSNIELYLPLVLLVLKKFGQKFLKKLSLRDFDRLQNSVIVVVVVINFVV